MANVTKLTLLPLMLSGLLWAGPLNDPPIPIVGLSEYTKVSVGHPTASLVMPLRCGPDGSILAQLNHVDRAPRASDYLLLIRPDGRTTRITLPEEMTGWVGDYQFGPQGEIYVLTQQRDDKAEMLRDWVIEFAKDGAYVRKTELNLSIDPRHFAWLDRNTLIVSGMRQPTIPEPHVPHLDFGPATTVLVNHRGEYLRDAVGIETPDKLLPTAISPDSLTPGAQLTKEQQSQVDEYDASSWLTRIETTLDGHAYFHPGLTHYVYVVGPDGKVAKRLTINLPEPHLRLLDIKVRDGLLFALFSGVTEKKLDSRYLLYDISTNKLWRHFRADSQKLGAAVACHSRSSLTLLGGEEGQMELRVVPIK